MRAAEFPATPPLLCSPKEWILGIYLRVIARWHYGDYSRIEAISLWAAVAATSFLSHFPQSITQISSWKRQATKESDMLSLAKITRPRTRKVHISSPVTIAYAAHDESLFTFIMPMPITSTYYITLNVKEADFATVYRCRSYQLRFVAMQDMKTRAFPAPQMRTMTFLMPTAATLMIDIFHCPSYAYFPILKHKLLEMRAQGPDDMFSWSPNSHALIFTDKEKSVDRLIIKSIFQINYQWEIYHAYCNATTFHFAECVVRINNENFVRKGRKEAILLSQRLMRL